MFNRHSKVVTASEKRYWQLLTIDYMTDESDSENGEEIILHHHPWRSDCKPI